MREVDVMQYLRALGQITLGNRTQDTLGAVRKFLADTESEFLIQQEEAQQKAQELYQLQPLVKAAEPIKKEDVHANKS